MMLDENLNGDGSHRFDRSRFDAKLHNFEKEVLGFNESGDCILDGTKSNDDDILSLDDSITDSTTGAEKKTAMQSYGGGALEKTLMLSPVKRVKNPGEQLKSPKSGRGRGLGLARFLKAQSPQSQHDKMEGGMPGLEPIWQYSDIMSVGASVAAKPHSGYDDDDQHTVGGRSAYTYHPASSGGGVAKPASPRSKSNILWDRATKTIAAVSKAGDENQQHWSSSASVSFPVKPSGKPKRSMSLDLAARSSSSFHGETPSSSMKSPGGGKSPRRKLKKGLNDRLSQSEHMALKAPSTPLVSPSGKSRIKMPSKAASLRDVNTGLTAITLRETGTEKAVREAITGVKKKKKVVKKSKSMVEPIIANMEEVQQKSPGGNNDGGDEIGAKTKKKRSMSLSRVGLYEPEPADPAKAKDPSKRRGGKRDQLSTSDVRSLSPKRNSSGASLPGGRRMSRRQLLKKMDSESVISAPADTSPMGCPGGRSLSPRPGRNSISQLPRRGDSRRNLLNGSLHQPNVDRVPTGDELSRSARSAVEDQQHVLTSPGKLPRRGDAKRNLNSGSSPLSAKSPRRLVSTTVVCRDPEDRNALVKRIESVNSFFGKANGEIGSAYPSVSQRHLMGDDDNEEEPKKPESIRRKSKSHNQSVSQRPPLVDEDNEGEPNKPEIIRRKTKSHSNHSTSQRRLVVDDDKEGGPKKPESIRRKSKSHSHIVSLRHVPVDEDKEEEPKKPESIRRKSKSHKPKSVRNLEAS